MTSGKPRVYIANIPYDMRWQEIKDIFKEKVGDVAYVELYEDSNGKSTGTGIVEFKEREAAELAIDKMHKYEIRGRGIIVREEREADRRRHQKMLQQQQQSQMGGDMDMGMGGGMGSNMGGGMSGSMGMGAGLGMGSGSMSTAGITPQILQQVGIEGPVTNQVFVANLDYKVTWKKLKDIFKMAGNVLHAEIKEDKDGKSRGIGTVQFEFPLEAVQAISMFNGQMLFDRAMSVRMDKQASSDNFGASSQPKLPAGLRSIGMGLGAGGQALNVAQIAGVGLGTGMGGMGGTGLGIYCIYMYSALSDS